MLTVLLVLGGVAPGPVSPSGAQAVNAVLQLFPSEVSLARGETTKVVAVVRNPASEPLRDVILDVITGEGVTADPPTADLGTLVMNSDRTQVFTLRSTGVLSSVPVRFVLKFNSGKDDQSHPNAVVSQLAVTERKPTPDDGLARVTLKSELDEVSDRRGGDIAVLVENTSAFSLTLEEVSAFGPTHVSVCSPVAVPSTSTTSATTPSACKEGTDSALRPGTRIEPRGAAVHTFTVRGVRHQITQGKQSLLFVVRVTTGVDEPNLRRTDTHIIDRTVDVKVFGESDLLTPLGVGSFLLLPGFLIVVVFVGLRSRTAIRAPVQSESDGGVRQATARVVDPEFWAWSIALSIAVVVLYAVIFDRDLRDGYDSDDLFRVWTGCVLMGLVAWSVVYSWVRWRRPVLTADDQAAKIVAKLARRRSRLTFRQITITDGGTNTLGLVLRDLADGKVLIAPRIAYEFSKRGDWFKRWFRTAVNSDDARRVRRRYLVAKAMPLVSVTMRWDAQGTWAQSPRTIDASMAAGGVPMKLLREP